MNVNTTSSVSSGKSAELLKASADASTESSDGVSEGFLDKLLSLMFGGKEEVAESKDGTAQLSDKEAVTDGEDATTLLSHALKEKGLQGLSAEQLQALTELSDADLTLIAQQQGVEIDDFKAQVSHELSADTAADIKSQTSLDAQSDIKDAEAIKSQSAQWMNAGQQLLGKLHQANQTLAGPTSNEASGKALPQEQLLAQAKLQDTVPTDALSDKELLELKRWHELSQPEAQAEVDAVIASSPISEQEFAQLMAVKQKHPELSQDQLKALLAAQRELQQEAQESMPTLASAAVNGVAVGTSGQEAVTPQNTAGADATMSDKQKLHQLQEMAALKTGSSTHWQANSQPLPQHNNTLVTDKAIATSQVVGNQDATTQQSIISANPMAAVAAASDKGVTEAVLKSTLGAKALDGLNKGKPAASGGQEASFAHQLASAAGQSLSGTNGVARAEATVAQHNAVQLTKDGSAADQLADRVQMMMSKNLKQIDIRLDPPELGRMHIKMQMHADGGASVHFTVANQHARDALEQSVPRLREMLSQQGVQLGGTSVQHQGAGQQQGYAAAGGQSGQSGSGSSLGNQENHDADIKLDLNVASKRDGISYYA